MKRMLPILGICAMALAAGAAGKVADRYLASTPVEIPTPAMSDSVDLNGTKFTTATLLESKGRLVDDLLNLHAVEADTAGIVKLPASEESITMSIWRTRLRPDRYVEGTIKVTSPAVFEVLLDDASVGKKTTREDSITSASTKDIELGFDPHVARTVTIKVLTEPGQTDATLKTEFVPKEEYQEITVDLTPELLNHFTIDTTEEGTRIYNAALSPDGKYLAVYYSHKYSKSNTRYWMDLQETATGKKIASSLSYGYKWMPASSQFYYTVKTDAGFDIYTIDVPSMEHKRLAADFPTRDFTISPSGTYLIYTKDQEGKAEEGPLKRIKDPDDRMPGNRDRTAIYKYDLASGLSYPLLYNKESVSMLDISNDGEQILLMSAVQTPAKYPFYSYNLLSVNARTLKCDTLVKDDPYIHTALFSPDGSRLFVIGGPDAFGGIGAEDNGHPIQNDFDNQGYIFDIATRTARAATLTFNPSLENAADWNAADGMIYFLAESGFDMNMYRLDPKTLEIKHLTQEVSYVRSLSVGNLNARWVAYTGCGFDYTGAGYLLDTKSGKTRLLGNPMAETMAKVELGTTSPWNFVARDGTTIEGYITLPPGFDKDKKYPMIVYYYGGTSPTAAGMSSPYSAQLFASRGYVVYMLNPSGATGYGQEFSARHVNAWGQYTADDIIEGVQKICDEHPYIDRDKIGCCGASYGGFMTQYLLTKTDIFAAAVSHAGISNVTSYWGEGYWGYSYNSVAAAKSYPWTNPELFTQGSLFNADKIHTPLLLLHGTADTNVPIGESIQIFNALKILDRDVELITVEDQNHFISDWDKRKLWHATIMAWFAKWLQDDPKWWDSMYD